MKRWNEKQIPDQFNYNSRNIFSKNKFHFGNAWYARLQYSSNNIEIYMHRRDQLYIRKYTIYIIRVLLNVWVEKHWFFIMCVYTFLFKFHIENNNNKTEKKTWESRHRLKTMTLEMNVYWWKYELSRSINHL